MSKEDDEKDKGKAFLLLWGIAAVIGGAVGFGEYGDFQHAVYGAAIGALVFLWLIVAGIIGP